jgi:hypothetical protein
MEGKSILLSEEAVVVVGTDIAGRFFTSRGVLKLGVGQLDDPSCEIC